MPQLEFYKNNDTDKVYWVDDPEQIGVRRFSFDKRKIYNLFADYPHNLTAEERRIFDSENPYWVEFFRERG